MTVFFLAHQLPMSSSKEQHLTEILGRMYDQMIHVIKESEDNKEKNIILFVGDVYGYMIDAIKAYEKQSKTTFRIAGIRDAKQKLTDHAEHVLDKLDIDLICDTSSPTAISNCLKPYVDEIVVISCRAENRIPTLARVIPHVPYLSTPTSESLRWASDKVQMRRMLRTYNKDISPKFTVIHDLTKESIKQIVEQVGFPLIVKPAGLAASKLVSICYHVEELEEVLKKVFKKIDHAYKETGKATEKEVLIEQFMDGNMYSIDAYVDQKGRAKFCQPVYVKTGKQIGFDDFFGYQQMTPTILSKESIMMAEFVAREAIHALGMRSTIAHVELMKTEQGWKIIELAARAGGFRHTLYHKSFGYSHVMNDLLIRMGQKPRVLKKVNGYTVAMKFFAKEEGTLESLTGIKKIQDLASFEKIYINKSVGDHCTYAKNGGSSVFNLIMFNKDRSELLADIRRVETLISIKTS